MRKLTLMLTALMVMSVAACSKKEQKNEEQTQNKTEMKQDSKTLVAYFSATGVTKGVANLIADATGGDLFEIAPEQPYTDEDLDWRNKKSRSSVEMADKTSRPAISKKVENIDKYEVVYLGYPIWWYTAPTIINTFVEENNLKGKTVIPFATSGGSSIDGSVKDLKEAYKDINWKNGKLLNNASKEMVEKWVAEAQN